MWTFEDIKWFIGLDNNNKKLDNIKPIFLKKIEDVEILLNVLEQDLKKETQKNLPQEKWLWATEDIFRIKIFYQIFFTIYYWVWKFFIHLSRIIF